MKILLASKSPRRRELLTMLGLDFTVAVADIDETMDPALSPAEAVCAVSRKKAAAIAAQAGPDDVVIAADTVVVVDDLILGKPRDEADAARMLKLLSGREHRVITALTLRRGDQEISEPVITTVRFRAMTDAEITAYVKTGEPMDKAGAYGIQGMGAIFIEGISGDYYTVMGLPLCALSRHLKTFEISIL
jgi:septum formation protein